MITNHRRKAGILRHLNNLHVDKQRLFLIAYPETDDDACDIRDNFGQEGIEVKITFDVPQHLDKRRGVRTMKVYCLKVEIAQRTLRDLGRENNVKA
jgi:hypothetical protein